MYFNCNFKQVLKSNNLDIIPLGDKNGAIALKAYPAILKEWKRKKDIEDSAHYNVAFNKFIDSLKAII